jgi:nitrite reductase (NADH) small subunit
VRHQVLEAELRPGEVRSVEIDGVRVAVLRTPAGDYRAMLDRCPHYGTKLSTGFIEPLLIGDKVGEYRTVEGKYVLRCPRHGYQFDVESGRCPADPDRVRVRSYDVSVEDGHVMLMSSERQKGK